MNPSQCEACSIDLYPVELAPDADLVGSRFIDGDDTPFALCLVCTDERDEHNAERAYEAAQAAHALRLLLT